MNNPDCLVNVFPFPVPSESAKNPPTSWAGAGGVSLGTVTVSNNVQTTETTPEYFGVPARASTDNRDVLAIYSVIRDTGVTALVGVVESGTGALVGDGANPVWVAGGGAAATGFDGEVTEGISSIDQRPLIRYWSIDEATGNPTPSLFEFDGVTLVADGSVFQPKPSGSAAAPQTDQTVATVNGADTDVPAGLKSVTVVARNGVVDIDGYRISAPSDATEPDSSVTFDVGHLSEVRLLLPAMTITQGSPGATWKWVGYQPAAEE